MNAMLPTAVQGYISACKAFDGGAVMAWFAEDAFVNDARREFWGGKPIRAWLDREVIGERVTMDVTSSTAHEGDIIVNAVMDGDYDKTALPSPLTLPTISRSGAS
jgi:hypothetical protein